MTDPRARAARRVVALDRINTDAPAAADRPLPWYHVGPVLALDDQDGQDPDTAPSADGDPEVSSTVDVYLYDVIGGWIGMTADDFVRDVASLDVDQIVLHLNTPGGDAMEGVAIANVLRAHRARVLVRVDGIAASAGSVVAMAGDEIVMGIGSELMLHDAWGIVLGDAAEITAFASRLDATSNSIASVYAVRTGGTTDEWRAVMQAETWYTAEEAVEAGLADRVAAADETGTAQGDQVRPGRAAGGFWEMWDSLRNPERFDLSAFTYAGRASAPAPAMPPARTTPATGGLAPTQEGSPSVAFTDDQIAAMRTQLGVADDADDDTILAALAERTTAPDPPPLPEGVVTIDATQLEALQNRARRGDEARARQEREDREGLVQAAVADGRIAPARSAHWLAQLEADPGSHEVLASLAKGLIPVGEPIGHDDGSDNDPLYAAVFGKDA